MIDFQALKDVDDIDHLTLEKIDHFTTRRISDEKFSSKKAAKLIKHIEMWHPETAEHIKNADLSDNESVYNTLRTIREIILKSI